MCVIADLASRGDVIELFLIEEAACLNIKQPWPRKRFLLM